MKLLDILMGRDAMNRRINDHDQRIESIERRMNSCDSKHEESQRRAEDAVKSHNTTNAILNTILEKITIFEQHLPALKRTTKNYLIFDSFNDGLIWLAKVATSVMALYGLYSLFKTLI